VGSTSAIPSTSPDGSVRLRIGLPADLARYVVEKGSICVDGVSLTVTGVHDDTDRDGRCFGVALVPHTLVSTTLGRRVPGDRLNVEVDVLAKYVERLLAPATARGPRER
jgi:riboflavin synthase